MRHFLHAILGPLSAAFLLAGCSGGGLIGSGGALQEKANLLIPAETPAERGLRACLGTAVVGELVTYRLFWFESTDQERQQAVLLMQNMKRTIEGVRFLPGEPDPFWAETEFFYIAIGLVHQLEGSVTEQGLQVVSDALTGNIGGLVTTARVRVGQAGLASVMIDDIQRYYAAEDKGTAEWLDRGWSFCLARVDANIVKLGGQVTTPLPTLSAPVIQ